MIDKQVSMARDVLGVIAAFTFVLFLHGAVPFFAMPTLAQAIWTIGFSQSFANESIFSIYATNFGGPEPAAIALGLAGAWPAAFLIKWGLHPADAYSGMAAFWLGVAFFAAYKIGRTFGVPRLLALLAAVLWMSMPIFWGHAGYSMVSFGIGLLPLYFYAALKLFISNSRLRKSSIFNIAFYIASTLTAVFMDGYSFMMFAVGSSLFCVYVAMTFPDFRKNIFTFGLPVHILSFSLAYFLYTTYIGNMKFEHEPIDIFRSMGIDLSFIAIPTSGTNWIFDFLGLSAKRIEKLYFGDSSVWTTTFCLPIVLAGMFSWWRVRYHTKIASGLLLLAVCGFYMAMGPSLKINSIKPEVMQHQNPRQQSALMSPDMAIMPTGNAWISENLPGFNAMRASYRWSALGILALWMMVLLLIGKKYPKGNFLSAGLLVALIGLNLPNIVKIWPRHVAYREMFFEIDHELAAALEQSLRRNELVAFLPYRNDFMMNYLASRLGVRTYNIGGDKNLSEARKHWPDEMKIFNPGELESSQLKNIALLLLNGDSDAIVIPYFNSLWAAHLWPCVEETKARLSEAGKNLFKSIPDFECPSQQRQKLSPILQLLKQIGFLSVTDSNLFATVRLRPEFSTAAARLLEKNKIIDSVKYPYPVVAITPNANINIVLVEGWHPLESTHVWSKASSALSLPVPTGCQEKQCTALLKFGVFGASQQRPVSVNFTTKEQGVQWSNTVLANSADTYEVSVPLKGGASNRLFSIDVPDATSPKILSGGADERTLGISLQRIDLQFTPDSKPTPSLEDIEYPIAINQNLLNLDLVLNDGWHPLESTHVWSNARSTLTLPVPKDCQGKKCAALLKFGVFGASQQRPVSVKFTTKDQGAQWSDTVLATGTDTYEVSVPLKGGAPTRPLSIDVPDATSPKILSGGADERTLGISLQRIDLQAD